MRLLSVMAVVAVSACGLYAQSSQVCKGNSEVVSECFVIHGRVRVVNGAGMVIWRIGTNRKLWVEDEELIPDNLGKAMYKTAGDVYGRDVFGDFELCPFTKSKAGEMQEICVQSASHLVVRENTH